MMMFEGEKKCFLEIMNSKLDVWQFFDKQIRCICGIGKGFDEEVQGHSLNRPLYFIDDMPINVHYIWIGPTC